MEREEDNENTSDKINSSEPKQIKIVLQGSADNKTVVLAKQTTKISKLLAAFCRERNVSSKEYRLVYKGKVLQETEEISSYNMKDNDVIEVVASQSGGN